MKVKDVSLNYFRFYLGDKDNDSDNERKEREESFRAILESAIKEIGGWEKTSQTEKPTVLRQRGSNLLIANSKGGWVKCPDSFYRKIISRSRLDVFTLQTGILKQGLLIDSKLTQTLEDLPKFNSPENENSFGSVCQCVFLELEDYKNIDSLETVFENIFKGLGYENPVYRKIDLDFARVAILENNREAVWAVIPSAEQFINKAGTFVDDILYEYFMAFSKVMNESITVQKDLVNARNSKYHLAKFLETNLSKTPKSLFKMEKAQEKLADLRIDLAVEMARIKRHINTININVGNLEKLLESSYLIGKKEELNKLLLNPLRLVCEQIKADLSYCEIDLEKGNLTNEKLEDITQIRLAKWGRKATLFFGLLSAIGILQLFPLEFGENKDFPFWARVAVIAGLIAVFVIAAFKDEIIGLFKRKDKTETDNQLSDN